MPLLRKDWCAFKYCLVVSFPAQRASYYNLALTHKYTVTYQCQSTHMLSHTIDTAQGNSDTNTAGGRDELKRREKIAFLKTLFCFFNFYANTS